MTTQATPRWGTPRQAAEALQVSTKTIHRMIARGEIPARRFSASIVRVDLTAIHAAHPSALGGDSE